MPANTHGADINELLLGYFLNNSKWFSTEAESQFKLKKKMVSDDEILAQTGRANAMADAVVIYLKQNHKGARVTKVWWTARPGSLSAAVGREVDQRKNPTDILVQLSNKEFVGLSAKSTGGGGDIGFKNPGLGTVEKALNLKLGMIAESAVASAIKTYKLPASTDARKQMIRSKAPIQAATQIMGEKVLAKIRDVMFDKLKGLPQKNLREYVLNYWMDANTGLYPPYYKVTGHGKPEGPFTAKIEDPLSNPKLKAVSKETLTVEKNGTSAIGIAAGGKKILKMRAKYESEKLASSVKFSGEPW